MRLPAALTFDLDGTLIDPASGEAALHQTCDELALVLPELDSERLLAANRRAWGAYWPTAEAQWVGGQLSGAALSLEVWRRTFAECGHSDRVLPSMARDLHARRSIEATRVFTDVLPFLRQVQSRFRTALITNGASDTQRPAVQAAGIGPYFETIIVSSEVGAAKPDPTIFRIALDELGVAAEDAWHVGDSLSADVAGARAAGMTAVWLNRRGGGPVEGVEPDYEVAALDAFVRLLGA